MSEPPPTGRCLEELEIERALDNTTQRAPGFRAESRDSWVSEITSPSRSMPPPMFVAACLTHGYEISPGLHAIPTVIKLSKLTRLGMVENRSYRYCWYCPRLASVMMIL